MTTTPDPIRALAEAATPGPWKVILPGDVRWEHRRKFRCVAFSRRRGEPYTTSPLRPDDAALIVAMRNGIDAILDERDALRAALQAIAAIHSKSPDGGMGYEPDSGLPHERSYGHMSSVCQVCGTSDEYGVTWPCATHEAARQALARAASPEQGL